MTRTPTWSSDCSMEWARRAGASPPKRMMAAWSSPDRGQPNTRALCEVRVQMAGSPRFVQTFDQRRRQNQAAAFDQPQTLSHPSRRTQPDQVRHRARRRQARCAPALPVACGHA